MKTIKKQFKRQGYLTSLIERNDYCAIYECKDTTSMVVHFEVVRVKKHRTTVRLGDYIANVGDEYLPSTNDWGTYGWTLMNYDSAKRKFEEVTKMIISRLN